MTQLAFYILSDIHGYIFPTDFKQTKGYKPMGLLLANHIIEQDRQRYDASFKIDNGDFYKVHLFVITLLHIYILASH